MNLTLVGYTGVVIALTLLKSFYTIGLLWKPENQRHQELRLVPFQIIQDANSTFSAVFDILGNLALFVPLGIMLMIVVRRAPVVLGVALLFSLGIEVTQYIFSLGRSDSTDVICNVAGAGVGAWIATWFSSRPGWSRHWHRALTVMVAVTVVVFVVLVILGPTLGDPTAVIPA